MVYRAYGILPQENGHMALIPMTAVPVQCHAMKTTLGLGLLLFWKNFNGSTWTYRNWLLSLTYRQLTIPANFVKYNLCVFLMYNLFVFLIISVFCTCQAYGDVSTPENARGNATLYLPLTLYNSEARETAVGEPWVTYVIIIKHLYLYVLTCKRCQQLQSLECQRVFWDATSGTRGRFHCRPWQCFCCRTKSSDETTRSVPEYY